MASDNPFATAFNPDRGGLTGFIGGLAGVPSNQERQGGATADALQELSDLKAGGLNNQQALMKFFQSPSGHDYFSNAGPDGIKQLTDGLAATTQAAPIMSNIPEGGMLTATNPQTGVTSTAASNPKSYPPTVLGPQDQAVDRNGNKIAENTNVKTGEIPADVKSFSFFSQLAQLPVSEVKRLAGLRADPTKGGPNSVVTESIDKLVSDYGLDPRLGEAMKAGQVKVLPLKNETGQDTGDVSVVDLTNPGAPTVQVLRAGSKGSASPSAVVPPAAGTSPSTGAATGALPAATGTEPAPTPSGTRASSIPTANPSYFGTKASMFLASGPIATGLQAASGISEMVNPKMIIPEGAQSADRQTMIETLRSDLSGMSQIGGSMGVNKGVLEGYLKLAPTGGLTESPHQAIQKAIRLSEHVQQEIDAQTEVYHNQNLPLEQRKGAQALIQGWSRVQRDLPTPDELVSMEKAIRNGTAGAPTISGAAETLAKAGSKALTEVKSEAGKVVDQQGLRPKEQPNIESITDPKEILAIDPRTLDKNSLIQYRRKIDFFKKNGAR